MDGLIVVGAVVALVTGFCFGNAARVDSMRSDCNNFGMTRVSGENYKCEKVK